MHTRVRVPTCATAADVVVRINDRGPYSRGTHHRRELCRSQAARNAGGWRGAGARRGAGTVRMCHCGTLPVANPDDATTPPRCSSSPTCTSATGAPRAARADAVGAVGDGRPARAQRRRQVDADEGAARPPAVRRRRARCSGTTCARSRRNSRGRRLHAGARLPPRRHERRRAVRLRGRAVGAAARRRRCSARTWCSSSSGSATSAISASTATRRAEAARQAGAGARARSRSCSCSTSRPTGSTRRGATRCWRWCASLPARTGCSIVLSSHLLHDVERVCERAILLHEGKIVYSGTIEALRKEGQKDVYEVRLKDGEEQLQAALERRGLRRRARGAHARVRARQARRQRAHRRSCCSTSPPPRACRCATWRRAS